MSFMFHPYPYIDHRAVNPVTVPAEVASDFTQGTISVARRLSKALEDGKRRIAIDGYTGVEFSVLKQVFEQYLPSQTRWIDGESLLKEGAEVERMTSCCLPTDRSIDPALLYGVRFSGSIEDLQDAAKIGDLQRLLSNETQPVVVIGRGSLSSPLCGLYDLRIWVDITPRTAALNFKYGRARNVGFDHEMPFNETMRRNYYVDFENAVNLRWKLIDADAIDWYMTADDMQQVSCMTWLHVKELFDELRKKPLRARPVYLEGVWGGFYFTKLRSLPKEMRNCAWVFDMIPMEVSLVAVIDGREFEVPFFTFVQEQKEKLLGAKAFKQFGGYFPIRFNYDDTYHSNGNMSIQCHPTADYVMRHHHELGRQDESYYVCATAQGACTYLGFLETDSCGKFFAKAREAEKDGSLVDYPAYVNRVPSEPGTQVMIPAGTIHASGRNQVVLEIGSLTIGSYTYKLYDYQRIDPQTLRPRPIHLNAGAKVIHPERTREWVERNLVNHGGILRQGKDKDGNPWMEKVVGEHDLLYFSLRNLKFWSSIDDDTEGTFHVLALVDGEAARIQSKRHPERSYDLRMLDIVTIPADFGPYTIINQGVGEVTVHKTLLKKERQAT